MSSAFVKEEDARWLHDIPPTIGALISHLTLENNGVRVYELNAYADANEGRKVHAMSNGLNYAVDDNSVWYIVW